MRSVLMVDDDIGLAEMMRDYLGRHGFAVDARHDGHSGLAAAQTGRYELMLLDVTLPGIDGLEVLRRLRAVSDLYVLLLSARGEPADRVRGLGLGADDYVAKPFAPEELVARIEAILRRTRGAAARPATTAADGLAIDAGSRAATYHGHLLELTNIEFSLLESFLESPGVVLTREDLMVRVFQRAFHPLDRSLDMYVSRLRRKLRTATPFGERIRTVRSLGYQFLTADSAMDQAKAFGAKAVM